MAEFGETSNGGKIVIGRVEQDPARPEIKTGTLALKITIGPDGVVYATQEKAIEGKEAYQDSVGR